MSSIVRQPPTRSIAARLGGDRHGPATTLALHLAPGIVFTGAAIPFARYAAGAGLPPIFGLLAANALVLMPVQLGLIALAARERTGSWKLGGAVGCTRRLPPRRLLLLGAATFAWAGLAFVLTAPVADWLQTSVFASWPSELDYAEHLGNADRYRRRMLIAAWVLGLAITTVAVPVVEELYFRGYLLPRIDHLGPWAPVLNTVLFACYHLWSPWQAPTRVAATLPLYYAVWRTRAIGLAIAVHVALNLVGDSVATAPLVFG